MEHLLKGIKGRLKNVVIVVDISPVLAKGIQSRVQWIPISLVTIMFVTLYLYAGDYESPYMGLSYLLINSSE